MSNPINDVMSTAMSSIKEMVDVNTVIGEAVQTPDGSVIIPICKVCFGISSGGGEYQGSIDFSNPMAGVSKPLDDKFVVPVKYPFAGGCATGVSITPTAFIKSGAGEVQLVPIDSSNTLDKLVNMVPDLFNKIMNLISEKTGRSQSESRNNSSGGADASAAEFYAPEE